MSSENTVVRTEAASFKPVVVKKGVYPAIYRGAKTIHFQDKATGRDVESFAHGFEVADGPEKGKVLDMVTSKKFNEKTRLFAMVASLSPRSVPEVDGRLDLDSLIGTRCSVLADTRKRADGTESSYVKEVLDA